jgi:hypothetical protein
VLPALARIDQTGIKRKGETKYTVAMDARVVSIAKEIVSRLQSDIESIIYYPQPFSDEGFVIAIRDDKFIPDIVAELCSIVPPGIQCYCLRRKELFQLSIPGQFINRTRNFVTDHPHLSFWIRNKGVLLYGADTIADIDAPSSRQDLLDIHIERCIFYLRNVCVLQLLAKQQYVTLIKQLDQHLRHVMATALLTHDEAWEMTS